MNYCDACCSNYMSELETVLVYTCWKQCVSVTLNYKRYLIKLEYELRGQQIDEENRIAITRIIETSRIDFEWNIIHPTDPNCKGDNCPPCTGYNCPKPVIIKPDPTDPDIFPKPTPSKVCDTEGEGEPEFLE